MSRLPRAWKNVCLVVIRAVMPLFYDRRYLRGAMFDQARIGWIWALHGVWQQKILGFDRAVPWPMFFRISDPDLQAEGKPVRIGRKCWIGMNAVILPGVTLGDHTVVGAGAVVSRSFPEGHCIVAG